MKNNNKGFTLVELLAVVIILGIILIIAVPSVSKYINDSRKNTYIATAKEYIKEVEKKVVAKEYKFYEKNKRYRVDISDVPLENEGNSPYGEWVEAYVEVEYLGSGKWKYYWASLDSAGFKVDLTESTELDTDDIYKVEK